MINRRQFISALVLLPYTVGLQAKTTQLFTNNAITLNKMLGPVSTHIKMIGDLDDDLFVIKTNKQISTMTECLQMHNPTNLFLYNGVDVKSTPIYGVINFDKNIEIHNNEILSLFVANEREELDNSPKLRSRSHFRAVELFSDNEILIPSLIPENNDVPNYPTWFGNENEACVIDPTKPIGYNYYKLWENAVCGGSFIIKESGKVIIKLYNKDDELMFTFEEKITTKMKNLVSNETKEELISNHPLVEVDGGIFGDKIDRCDDERIKKNAITRAIITVKENQHEVVFPYPLPYPNRLYMKALYKNEDL